MVNDIRVLNRERFNRENRPAGGKPNRHLRRELDRLAKRQGERVRLAQILPSQETKGVKGENTEAKQEDLVQMPANPPGFVRGRAGLLVSAILAAELAAAGCGSVVWLDEDADADEDVAADVQPDVEDDSAGPDVHDVDAEDEGSVDVDAEDVHEVEEDGDTNEGGDDAGPDEADVPDCEPVTYLEPRPATSAGTICGRPREKTVTLQITERGAGCPRPGRETSLESVVYRIMGQLDLANLICARGNETEALNPGTYLIISLSPGEMKIGLKLAVGLNMRYGSILNGGAYSLELTDVVGTSYSTNRLLDSSGTYVRNIQVPGQNASAPLTVYATIDLNNGALAWEQMASTSASQGIIRLNGGLPIVLAHLGTHDYESPGDEGRFTVRLNIDGLGSDESYGFYRIRGK